jgi:hypothetical protein
MQPPQSYQIFVMMKPFQNKILYAAQVQAFHNFCLMHTQKSLLPITLLPTYLYQEDERALPRISEPLNPLFPCISLPLITDSSLSHIKGLIRNARVYLTIFKLYRQTQQKMLLLLLLLLLSYSLKIVIDTRTTGWAIQNLQVYIPRLRQLIGRRGRSWDNKVNIYLVEMWSEDVSWV